MIVHGAAASRTEVLPIQPNPVATARAGPVHGQTTTAAHRAAGTGSLTPEAAGEEDRIPTQTVPTRLRAVQEMTTVRTHLHEAREAAVVPVHHAVAEAETNTPYFQH